MRWQMHSHCRRTFQSPAPPWYCSHRNAVATKRHKLLLPRRQYAARPYHQAGPAPGEARGGVLAAAKLRCCHAPRQVRPSCIARQRNCRFPAAHGKHVETSGGELSPPGNSTNAVDFNLTNHSLCRVNKAGKSQTRLL